MTQTPEPSFQPLSMLPVFSKLIDEMLSAALENHKSLTKAAPTPSVLDDDTVSRVIKVFTEMREDLWYYDEQLLRWSIETLSGKEREEVNRLKLQMEKVHTVFLAILDLANTLKAQTIEKILAMNDAELAVRMLTACQ